MSHTVDIIQKKRDGKELPATEIRSLVSGYMEGAVPDYQMSAWLMATLLKGLTLDETLALTDALVDSGDRLDLTGLGLRVVDKHSTGGVGDKVTLVLGPVVAACGAVFGKMSGSGLGHTGGTVDKLESIPGYRTDLTTDEFVSQLREKGICVIGQTTNLVPADRKLYALRDVTGTIESNSLVAASVMSKKIAGGAAAVVLDIKLGRGSFFKTRGHASGVAHLMEKIGAARGIEVEAVMTSMEQPLGHAVGNALEVMEAVETLKGHGPSDLVEVVIALATRLLKMSDPVFDPDKAATAARCALSGGSALMKFKEWITAQGGDASFAGDTARLPVAAKTAGVFSPRDGYVESLDAKRVGRSVLELGAGRRTKDDVVDHGVGAVLHAKVGHRVKTGDLLATVYARTAESAAAAAYTLGHSYVIGSEEVKKPSPLLY